MKRAIDISGALVGLTLFALPMLLVALLVRWRMGAPVLFEQERSGLHCRPFRMYKFRSMIYAVDANKCPLPDEQRLTSFGRFLRSTSLDELPSLWNVLRGEMSLVGPRPLLMEYLPLYSNEQMRRFNVRPGLTGWAQVNGRNELSWTDRLALDTWYVDHRHLWLDLRILGWTAIKVLTREGVNAPGEATMPRFEGDGN